ncbi:MAG TPA: aldo/keto reductase [Bryobacteraceae bacterium]|jgi:aryl-alcohol dehydrogenase-like predicted oxidoreductase|nr:aldo/keto reductase [Bryobacteraceae bacterium]
MQRRIFVGGAFAGLPGAAFARPAKLRAGDIPTRTFGKTGVKLTVIGQAGGRFPLLPDKEDARKIVRRAYELGINYFDCAHAYWDGRSEEVYGDVLPQWRKEVFLTTKSAKRTRQGAEEELHLSLKRLKTDYIDLWQMHSLNEKEEVGRIFGPGGAIEAFEAAKKAGKCRFFGFTGHHDPYVHQAMLEAYPHYDSILMPLNAADPAYLSFERLVLPAAVERGIGIQAMKPFANAKLLSTLSARDCLEYVLSLPVHCVAVGCTTIGQIEDDVRIAQSFRPLAGEQMTSLRTRAARIKGPATEDWKRNVENAGLPATHRDV